MSKKIKYGKVPRLLRKKYTWNSLNKKIYKKIYIPDDKKFIESYIQELEQKNRKGESLYSIPKNAQIEKKDCKRLKSICKEIQSQKGTFKWKPLLAIAIFIAAIGITITLTKNIVARKIITNTCEEIFEAKCDIGYLNITFMDSAMRINNLQVANKNEPMKNLFQIDSIVLNFEFWHLVKGRVIIDEISVNGVATDTPRSYSGDITAKRLAKIAKKKAKKAAQQKKMQESAFMQDLTRRSNAALDSLQNSVLTLFEKYNPQNIVQDCYSQMITPEMAKKIEAQVYVFIDKYKDIPKQLETEVNKVKDVIEAASKINIYEFQSDPTKIKEAIEVINQAYNTVMSLKTTAENMIAGLKEDVLTVTGLSKELQEAITHDASLVTAKVNELTSIRLDDIQNYISSTFDNAAYAFMGKYYPYLKQAINYLIELKNTYKPKEEKIKPEKQQITPRERLPGRTVHFPNEQAPRVWIKKISGSGPNFSFTARHISTDMNKTGVPATLDVQFDIQTIIHNIKLSVDTRSYSDAPLIDADYKCSNLKLACPSSVFGDYPGVPGLDSCLASLGCNLKIYENEGFVLNGSGSLRDVMLSVNPFKPEFVSEIVMNVLGNINSLDLSIDAGYRTTEGLILKIETDADKVFMNALMTELKAQLSKLLELAKQEIGTRITEFTHGAINGIELFDGISTDIHSWSEFINNLSKQLENKMNEAKNLLEQTAKAVADKAVDEAKKAANKAVDNAKKTATEAVNNALNSTIENTFGGSLNKPLNGLFKF